MVVKKLQKARTLRKMIAQRKLSRIRRTLESTMSAKKETPIEIKRLEKTEAIKTLKEFVKLAKDFIPRQGWQTEMGKLLAAIDEELKQRNPDSQSLVYLLRKAERDKLELEINRHLENWVLKNLDKIEPMIREEMKKKYGEDVANRVVISPTPFTMRYEEINNYRSGSILPREDTWLHIVSKLSKRHIDLRGTKEEKIKQIMKYKMKNKSMENIVKQADKAIELMERGKDPIFIDPLGHKRTLVLGGEEPEIIGTYEKYTSDVDHELGHVRGFEKMREKGIEMRNLKEGDIIFEKAVHEAIAYLNESRNKEHYKMYRLKDPDLEHDIGWIIAINAERLGLTIDDLIEGTKDPKKFVVDLLEKLKDDEKVKELRRKLKIQGYI